jgi:hypothetical protein
MDDLEAIEGVWRCGSGDGVCVQHGGVVAVDEIEVWWQRAHLSRCEERRAQD